MSKETFKAFVRNHPELISKVNNSDMTWRKFYEMYDMYGEDNDIWNDYFIRTNTTNTAGSFMKDTSIQELVNMVKKIDLDSVRKGINGLQKAIGIVQDLGIGKSKDNITNNYEPRPMYKYFED